MLKSLNHWVFAFILCQKITNPMTGKMLYDTRFHQSLYIFQLLMVSLEKRQKANCKKLCWKKAIQR